MNEKPQAPYRDYGGNPVFEGDLIQKADNRRGLVVIDPLFTGPTKWRFVSPDGLSFNLGYQLGWAGMGLVVKDGSRLLCPFPDFAGKPIHEGDTVRLPLYGSGKVVIKPNYQEINKWRLVFKEGDDLSLRNQITEKGQGVVV